MSDEVYGRDLPLILRLFGCWGVQERWTSFRMKWGQVVTNRLGFALSYGVYHEEAHIQIHVLWPLIFIKAPMLINQRPGTEDWWATYGFSCHARDIHLNWRTRCKIIHLPWDWRHVRHDVFDKNGKRRTWKPDYPTILKRGESERAPPQDDGRYKETHDYTYVLRSGEVQKRTATIYGEEMEWRWRWFTWLPWPRKISRSISVDFSDEVGERTGSWKGGTVGCSWEWREGETMLDALRQMERERKFT